MKKKERALKIIEELSALYPMAGCTLKYSDPLQLLIATQLAAQCTDERVNIVTESLFKKYRTVEDFAGADIRELEGDIRSTGFYHNKARNIIACCQKIISDYGGKVPDTMEKLLTLPGVGRKTANVILGDVFKTPGIVVDTHAKRLSRRIGFTREEDPVKIEFDLMRIIPKDKWTVFSHMLVFHGRAVCKARNPECGLCTIRSYCDFVNKKQDVQ
ncbi:MAG TPA: endonuclease III [Clostridia bacterium]